MTRRTKILGGIALFFVLAIGGLMAALSHDSACPAPPPTPAGATMKALMQRCYGGPEVLKVERIAKPVPADDEVLVKVRAAGVNPLDWHYMRGKPYLLRMGAGFGARGETRFGVDFAGSVEAVGKSVTKFKAGDDVFGGRTGAFAQYVVVAETGSIAIKPANVSFEEAAGVGVAAITAVQAMRDQAHLEAGEKVLVNGASGGVGTFAVQLAKAWGADVTAVCSTRNVELVKSLGADRVIDYTREDFTQGDVKYDVIIDTPGNRSFGDYRKVLAEDGRYVLVGGPKEGEWLGPLTKALGAKVYSPFVSQEYFMLMAKLNPADLDYLRGFLESGAVKTVIDRRYTLEQAGEAVRYVELGHARGKVVVLPE